MDFRPIFFVVGLMVAALGVAMFIPMTVDYLYGDTSWPTFAMSGIFTTLFGAVMAVASFTPKPELRARGGFFTDNTGLGGSIGHGGPAFYYGPHVDEPYRRAL